MVRIACFADDDILLTAVQHALNQPTILLSRLSASILSDAVRQTARNAAPDLILLELTPALSNAHVVFFLRADKITRCVPIILFSYTPSLASHAAALGADAFVRLPATTEQISETVFNLLPVMPAREVGVIPTRMPILFSN